MQIFITEHNSWELTHITRNHYFFTRTSLTGSSLLCRYTFEIQDSPQQHWPSGFPESTRSPEWTTWQSSKDSFLRQSWPSTLRDKPWCSERQRSQLERGGWSWRGCWRGNFESHRESWRRCHCHELRKVSHKWARWWHCRRSWQRSRRWSSGSSRSAPSARWSPQPRCWRIQWGGRWEEQTRDRGFQGSEEDNHELCWRKKECTIG